MSSPYGPPPPLASPWHTAYQTFTPAAGLGARLPPTGPPPQAQGPPPGAWGQPPQQHSGFYGQPPHSASFFHHDPAAAAWAQAQAQQQQYSYFGAPQPPQPTREPPGQQNADRMPIFSTGPHYGPVLEPFIVRALQIELKLNPLISPPGDDPSAHAYLKWNMLFPTSTVQRTDDKHHMSWMDGRDAPATFPRVTVLHLVSEHFPWMFTVSEKVPDRGVTCGEVIDAIGAELSKLTTGADYSGLSKPNQGAVSLAYNHNRSRNPGVPGGALGKGLRRLDFLKRNVNFAGIEVNSQMVWRLLGETFPCTFVLKSEPFTRREAEEQDLTRLRPGSSQGGRSRSRAGSMKISVHSPSDKSHSDNDSLDNDR
ncbi:hypothetical protein CPC08DRAFT_640590 [Agrocybe pediades]|nr:hypothetical protein CPC08DRAFT_640590 [Agrocybe pediades]